MKTFVYFLLAGVVGAVFMAEHAGYRFVSEDNKTSLFIGLMLCVLGLELLFAIGRVVFSKKNIL